MIYGYCRVSTKGQAKDGNSLDAQEQEILSRYSDAHIYKEAYTGTTTDRPVFNEVIQQMQENDMLVVSKLDRLARNTEEGIKIVKNLFLKKCSVHVLNVGLLEDTAMGQQNLKGIRLLNAVRLEKPLHDRTRISPKADQKSTPSSRCNTL